MEKQGLSILLQGGVGGLGCAPQPPRRGESQQHRGCGVDPGKAIPSQSSGRAEDAHEERAQDLSNGERHCHPGQQRCRVRGNLLPEPNP